MAAKALLGAPADSADGLTANSGEGSQALSRGGGGVSVQIYRQNHLWGLGPGGGGWGGLDSAHAQAWGAGVSVGVWCTPALGGRGPSGVQGGTSALLSPPHHLAEASGCGEVPGSLVFLSGLPRPRLRGWNFWGALPWGAQAAGRPSSPTEAVASQPREPGSLQTQDPWAPQCPHL